MPPKNYEKKIPAYKKVSITVGMHLEPLFFVSVVSVLGKWSKLDFFKPSSDLGKKILSLRKILWTSRLRTVAFKNNSNEHVWRNVGDVISSSLLVCPRVFLTRQKYGSERQSKQKTIFVSSTNQQFGLPLFFFILEFACISTKATARSQSCTMQPPKIFSQLCEICVQNFLAEWNFRCNDFERTQRMLLRCANLQVAIQSRLRQTRKWKLFQQNQQTNLLWTRKTPSITHFNNLGFKKKESHKIDWADKIFLNVAKQFDDFETSRWWLHAWNSADLFG